MHLSALMQFPAKRFAHQKMYRYPCLDGRVTYNERATNTPRNNNLNALSACSSRSDP